MKNKVLMQGFEPKDKYIQGYSRFIFGLGPQADRHLMQLKKKKKVLPNLALDHLALMHQMFLSILWFVEVF